MQSNSQKNQILDPSYCLSMTVPLVNTLEIDIKWVHLKSKKGKKDRAEAKE